MIEQEQEALEQAAKPQRWGSKERMALVAEVLRQRRIVECLVRVLVEFYGECPPDKHAGEECRQSAGCLSCWVLWAEQAVAEEISPKG